MVNYNIFLIESLFDKKLFDVLISIRDIFFWVHKESIYFKYYFLIPGLIYFLSCSLMFFIHPISALLAFIVLSLCIMFLLFYFNIHFLAIVFGLLYIGAILIIFLFVIMLFRKVPTKEINEHIPLEMQFTLTLSLITFIGLTLLYSQKFLIQKIFNRNLFSTSDTNVVQGTDDVLFRTSVIDNFDKYLILKNFPENNVLSSLSRRNIEVFVQTLYEEYFFFFLTSGFILLTAMVGAINIIYLTNKKN